MMDTRVEHSEPKIQSPETNKQASSALFDDSLDKQISSKAAGIQENKYNMDYAEKASRIAQVSLEGIGYSVPGAWHAVKHDLDPANWKETGLKVLSAGTLGVAMRVALPEAGTFRTVADTAMALYFLKDAAKPVLCAWHNVTSQSGEAIMTSSAKHLGDNIGSFLVDGYLSGKIAAFTGLLTPAYAEHYAPRQWQTLQNWKESHFGPEYPAAQKAQPGQLRFGIGIEPAEQATVKNGILDAELDSGHCFAYVKDASGKVVNVISTGPDVPPNFGNSKLHYFSSALGQMHSRGDWPLHEPMSTWEWPISKPAYEKALAMIQQEKLHPGNYTPFHDCPTLPIEIGQAIGLHIPSGFSLVRTPVGTLPLANPFGLQQQLNKIMPSRAGSLNDFQGPALDSPYGRPTPVTLITLLRREAIQKTDGTIRVVVA